MSDTDTHTHYYFGFNAETEPAKVKIYATPSISFLPAGYNRITNRLPGFQSVEAFENAMWNLLSRPQKRNVVNNPHGSEVKVQSTKKFFMRTLGAPQSIVENYEYATLMRAIPQTISNDEWFKALKTCVESNAVFEANPENVRTGYTMLSKFLRGEVPEDTPEDKEAKRTIHMLKELLPTQIASFLTGLGITFDDIPGRTTGNAYIAIHYWMWYEKQLDAFIQDAYNTTNRIPTEGPAWLTLGFKLDVIYWMMHKFLDWTRRVRHQDKTYVFMTQSEIENSCHVTPAMVANLDYHVERYTGPQHIINLLSRDGMLSHPTGESAANATGAGSDNDVAHYEGIAPMGKIFAKTYEWIDRHLLHKVLEVEDPTKALKLTTLHMQHIKSPNDLRKLLSDADKDFMPVKDAFITAVDKDEFSKIIDQFGREVQEHVDQNTGSPNAEFLSKTSATHGTKIWKTYKAILSSLKVNRYYRIIFCMSTYSMRSMKPILETLKSICFGDISHDDVNFDADIIRLFLSAHKTGGFNHHRVWSQWKKDVVEYKADLSRTDMDWLTDAQGYLPDDIERMNGSQGSMSPVAGASSSGADALEDAAARLRLALQQPREKTPETHVVHNPAYVRDNNESESDAVDEGAQGSEDELASGDEANADEDDATPSAKSKKGKKKSYKRKAGASASSSSDSATPKAKKTKAPKTIAVPQAVTTMIRCDPTGFDKTVTHVVELVAKCISNKKLAPKIAQVVTTIVQNKLVNMYPGQKEFMELADKSIAEIMTVPDEISEDSTPTSKFIINKLGLEFVVAAIQVYDSDAYKKAIREVSKSETIRENIVAFCIGNVTADNWTGNVFDLFSDMASSGDGTVIEGWVRVNVFKVKPAV